MVTYHAGNIKLLSKGLPPSNPKVLLKASNVLESEVCRLLDEGAIKEVCPVPGQYVSSYFAVPKLKRTPDK